MSIKAIIFDFFGVLCADEYWRYVKSDRQTDGVFQEFADEVNLGEITWKSFVEKVAKMTGTSVDDVNRMYETEKIDPRMAGLIDTLHVTYKTALLSNAHHEFIDNLLEQNHLRQLFDEVIVSSRLGVVKPDPQIFKHALAKLGVEPADAVYIDDLERHVAAAESLGIRAILYRDFEQTKRELEAILATQ